MARLQWVDRDGEMFALHERPVLVGKDASCIIRPKRLRCAARHARISFVDGRHIVEAISEADTVFVNGVAISTRVLEHRDEIVCGDLRMVFWRDESS